jgi:DNA ligase (NAD+)
MLELIENANEIPVPELEKLIEHLSDAYYNSDELVEDDVFDELVEILRERSPKSKVLTSIGAPPRDSKVSLPFLALGLDKVKPDSNELKLFFTKNKGPYVISEKIDGDSCIIEYKDGEVKMYTRGRNGIGKDITFLKKYLSLPDLKIDLQLRGELTVSKKIFESKFKHLKKPRTVITSMITSQKGQKGIVFLAFEIVSTEKPSDKFKRLEELGFKTPWNKKIKHLTSKVLSENLKEREEDSGYDVDGIVVADDNEYPVNTGTRNSKNTVAFKTNKKGVLTTIEDVIWRATKHGILFPRLRITPVVIDGDTVTFISGKHAKYIVDNKLGPGSQISVVRSGEVIPDIEKIIKSTKASLPDLEFEWDKTGVNIVLIKKEDDPEVQIKKLLHFFEKIGVERFKEGTVKKFYFSKFNNVSAICLAKEEDFLAVEGIHEKSANIIFTEIHKKIDEPIPLNILMFASFMFPKNMGSKRFKLVVDDYPKVYKYKIPSKEELLEIEGFSDILAEQFIEGFQKFVDFMKAHPFLKVAKPSKPTEGGGEYSGKFIVFSGFRDKKLEEDLTSKGAVVESGITKNTNLMIVDDLDSTSSKVEKAKKKGIKMVLRT